MNIKTQLITLTLLCILHATNIGASAPAKPYEALAKYGQAAIPASLQAELKRIEDLPDHKVLTTVVPCSIDVAEQSLRKYEDKFKGLQNSLASAQAKPHRSALKYWTIKKELSLCPAGALKQTLQSKLDEAENQCYAHQQEEQRCVGCKPVVASIFMTDMHNALSSQASILLAQKETEKAQWQQKESQWQQEKQSLKEKLKKSQEDLEQLRILHRRPLDPKAKKVTKTLDMQKFVQLACIKKNS